jgi:hypothetical protein
MKEGTIVQKREDFSLFKYREFGVYSMNKTGGIGGKCSVLGQMWRSVLGRMRHNDSVSYS